MTSIVTYPKTGGIVEAKFANESAISFSTLGIWKISSSSNQLVIFRATLKYDNIRSSFTSKNLLNCETTKCESL